MRSINPSSGMLINDYASHSTSETSKIITSTNETWIMWRKTSFQQRSRLMHNAASVLRNEKEDLARLMSLEMGKVLHEAAAEIEKCAWVCEYYADHAESFLADEIVETNASKSFVSFAPIGIVLAVMPWNFPFWQVFRFAAPALMAGNAAVLKHASNVPGCALAIEEIFIKAGFPVNLFRTLMISASQVESVIMNPHIRAVTLTGSEAAGMNVASIAGRALKKTVLELGGSDPYIVLDDADIDKCVETAVNARMINNGQSCIAAKRFIVVESRLEEFETKKTMIMSTLTPGDPLLQDTQVGPLAREDLRDELHNQVKTSLDAGARLLLGGKSISGPGYFYEPTVVSDVRPGMSLYHEETFGPVSAIIPVKDADEAIKVANDSKFGLGGSLWTNDLTQGEKLARQIESGAVFVNGMTISDPRLPFGGIKRSGYGRELSQFGIREFTNIKSIWIA
ncbi:MAG: NAD-dependent succinate-semialdehyde dehydrogenase [Candidatus Marinimicrobia bacterium]|nr:NAD-dependent succinate-semialdehyde dehydrogenase [Candidatus Neomarinimicrobiota bacterium]MBT4359752.1 NAD-dependent succinate-semialdehyde dehydrogenase [Candidatus Neomarinimicrobiota bacterium]MBT4714632.1 NAD-dependent succinate-semialdehyde dehydrogenase [Candidatus Neomarinimicrobiota bacterium]MBT4945183.1 NAD-dependent succinate-semialdehyde dehydrogenase [Candidatus Neomarinimicrobiota bacterium]MBT5269927.1 NAD-dependent succinate-semialdehyde dehydrogenase [Candidatus Neomarini